MNWLAYSNAVKSGYRQALVAFLGILVIAIVVLQSSSWWHVDFIRPSPVSGPSAVNETRIHVILPASKPDVNLCKLLLGLSVLGYTTPTLLGWQESFERPGILGGGSHIAKVSKVLEYLEALPPQNDGDLIFMMDAYDIHVQLPPATLARRYEETQRAAQDRLVGDLQQTATQYGFRERIMFGAGKRCAPNQPHTIACYPLPESPLPADLYGPNTDTVIGHNHWWSNRQRYLNSGYILGPASDMRVMFREAWRRIKEHPEQDPEDDGSHGSDFMYHGSDQSIFAAMYGRQAWTREKLRLQAEESSLSRPRSGSILGTLVDNVLDPSFTHENFDPDMRNGDWWKAYEFGIYLDFWSDVGHQTINSEDDGKWFVRTHEKSILEQASPRHRLDCPVRVSDQLPQDVVSESSAVEQLVLSNWEDRPLYTHLCTGRVPVLVHMNGMKWHREERWPLMWYQPQSRRLVNDLQIERRQQLEAASFAAHQSSPKADGPLGAWSGDGQFNTWDQTCGPEYHAELFREA